MTGQVIGTIIAVVIMVAVVGLIIWAENHEDED